MLEVFVHQFLVNLNMLVRAGVARRYISVEENLPYIRGKLLFREQLRENLTDRARFFVAHDELSINRPANRLIHSALGKLARVIRSDANRQLLRQLAAVFSSVPPTNDPRADWEIHEAVADLDDETAEIVLTIHWMGGAHTELRLPRRRRGQRNGTSPDIVAAVGQLVLIVKNDVIAGILNRNGLRTGNDNRWTRERVTSLRSTHEIPVHRSVEDGCEPWLNLREAAALVGVAPRTLRIAAEKGEIEAMHPLADGPWIFKRQDLAGETAQSIARRARRDHKHPTVAP